ncbi:group III truncated hemoglobin [Paraflavisolibacter sp. H34]|uniref:group III truncated hemoglobin n=1 Tax=Huijunlia imazamoxiresistens TaxID=3127457 RepID=UPI0030199DEF
MQQQDILNIEDVRRLVDTFYTKVRGDEVLGPIFEERIGDRWAEHLEKMYRFWQTLLLEEHTYFGAPFPPHAQLPVDAPHFERWLQLFHASVDELFAGEKAEEAKWRGRRMAEVFEAKIAYLQRRHHI